MLPIVLISILALAGSSEAWPSKKDKPDAVLQANDLLIEVDPEAKTLGQMIKTARDLINSKQVPNSKVKEIFYAFGILEGMLLDSEEGTYICDSTNIEIQNNVHNVLKKYTEDGVYYEGENAERPLNRNILDFSMKWAQTCLKRLTKEYREIYKKQNPERRLAMDHLAELVVGYSSNAWETLIEASKLPEGEHVSTSSTGINTWGHVLEKLYKLYGYDGGLRRYNRKTGKLELAESETRQFLEWLIIHTCSHYEQQREALFVLRRAGRLPASIQPIEQLSAKVDSDVMQLSKHALGMMVCFDMKKINQDDLAKRITADVREWQ